MDPAKAQGKFLDPKKVLREIGIAQNMSFADFGCGAGYFTIPAARMVGEHGVVYAVDILKSVLQDVRGKSKIGGLHNIRTIWADLEVPGSTKLKDGSIDIVFITHVFFQIEKKAPILEEAKRVVKPDGKIVTIDWAKVKIPFGPPLEKRVSKEEVIEVASAIGLNAVSEFDAGSYHYGLIFSK